MKKYILMCVGLTLWSSYAALSQGFMVDKGKNSILLNGGFLTNQESVGGGIGAGFSGSGMCDLGLTSTFSTAEGMLLGYDVNIVSLVPTLAIYPVKADNEIPVTIGVWAGYSFQWYSSEAFKKLHLDMKGHLTAFGLGVHVPVQLASNVRMWPSVGGSLTFRTVEAKDENDETVMEQKDNLGGVQLSLPFAFQTGPKTIVALTTGVAITKSVTTFAITIDFVFGTIQ